MNGAPVGLPIAEMAALDFVRWDRFTVGASGVSMVFGWIDGLDGLRDFVILRPVGEGVEVMTSSGDRGREIYLALFETEPKGEHDRCRRVEDAPEAAAELFTVARSRVAKLAKDPAEVRRLEIPGQNGAAGLRISVKADGGLSLWPVDSRLGDGFDLSRPAALALRQLLMQELREDDPV